jgi:GTP-binding protein HflX
LIAGRIKQLQKRLLKVRNSRGQSRKSRQKAELPTVSIVGYTNAGKSTLFNRLTESNVYAADQLFATLDPTLRRIEIPDCGPVILADTVGFIRELPHDLVEAFQSTLQETREADLLLHVVDVSIDNYQENMQQVNLVLKEIGADRIPQLIVCNKIDAVTGREARIDYDAAGNPQRVWLSAMNGIGLDHLLVALSRALHPDVVLVTINLPISLGRLRAELFRYGTVMAEKTTLEGNMELEVLIKRKDLAYLHTKGDFISQQMVTGNPPETFAVAGQG